jgi:hypothetical protein
MVTTEHAQRMAKGYAILLDAFERSHPEPPDCSYSPNWWCWIIVFGIIGLMVTGFLFASWLFSFDVR